MSVSDFIWPARSNLRASDWGFALRLEAHFDESGTDASELTVAGYLFDAERVAEFSDEWNKILAENGVPFFHMVECAPGKKNFAHLDKNERVRMQMRLMRLIKRFSINGFVCNINRQADNSGTSYNEAVRMTLNAVMNWANSTAFAGRIEYFLEAGATGQGLADASLKEIAADPVRASAHRYARHAFIPKVGNPGVQAADLLAWQYHNFTKKRAQASLARLDLRALFRHPHSVFDECGEPPRASSQQSVKMSRARIETVHYLPTVSEEQTKCGAVLLPSKDGAIASQADALTIDLVLACPNCLRALCELSKTNCIRDIYLKCWCGTYCATPSVLPPYAT